MHRKTDLYLGLNIHLFVSMCMLFHILKLNEEQNVISTRCPSHQSFVIQKKPSYVYLLT